MSLEDPFIFLKKYELSYQEVVLNKSLCDDPCAVAKRTVHLASPRFTGYRGGLKLPIGRGPSREKQLYPALSPMADCN